MTTLATARGLRQHRLRSIAQAARFGVVGASGYLVNLVVFAGLIALGTGHRVAAVAAFLVAVVNNFHWNRRWTFRTAGSAPRFMLVAIASFLLALAVLEALVAAGTQPVIAQAASIVLATPLSYFGNRAWSFRR